MDTTQLLTELHSFAYPSVDPSVGSSVDPSVDPSVSPGHAVPSHWHSPPIAVVAPSQEADVAHLIRSVERANVALIPEGGGTHRDAGYPPLPDRPYVLLSTRRMKSILDYQPDDMTITCQPGVTLSEVQAHLATRRQFLPLDVPFPDRATLGGIVATNRSGYRRLVYGTPRDLVIGVRAVIHGGETVKGGGKVVKNVAGYDVCKLFTGSWGTLGIISEVTFKVYPLPDDERLLFVPTSDMVRATETGLCLHRAQLAPTSILAKNELSLPNGSGTLSGLLVLLSGPATRLDWQTAEITRIVTEQGLPTPVTLPIEALQSLWNGLICESESTPLGGKIACQLSDLTHLLTTLSKLPNTHLTVDCGMGVIYFATLQPDEEFVRTVVSTKPETANLFWYRIHSSLRRRSDIASLDLWGSPREAGALQRAIKRSIDPQATFNPDRFLTDRH